jgi:hypothetical protein
VVALKPFDFTEDFVFASEMCKHNPLTSTPTTCVIKLPSYSNIAQDCYETAKSHNRSTLEWGVIGPKLLSSMIAKCCLEEYVKPPFEFCPISWFNILDLLSDKEICPESHAIHLWHEIWKRQIIDTNGSFPEGAIYERLKKRYLHPHS